MIEIWKDVVGFEGKYIISNLGNVATLDWRGTNKSKQLKKTKNSNGYYTVSLKDETGSKQHYVHRLVADAFIPKIDGKTFINHKDCNKKNNNADNLEWCTPKENIVHASINHRFPERKGIPLAHKHKRVRMIDKRSNEIIKVFSDVMEAREYIGDDYLHTSHIYSCLSGNRKSHKGYIWEWE